LVSRRLAYEPLGVNHAAALFGPLSDARVWRHIGPPDSTSVDELAAEFARRAAGPGSEAGAERWINYAVRVVESGAYCGRIEATVHGTWAEIAYLFGPAFWGHGFATEAVSWLREDLRQRFGVTELWAAVRPDNERSLRLLRRIGFVERTPASSVAAERTLSSADGGDLQLRWSEARA
jgi:RimJ/RimL family protein N-acetyltransferase